MQSDREELRRVPLILRAIANGAPQPAALPWTKCLWLHGRSALLLETPRKFGRSCFWALC
jgi:hypothetical protein